MLRSAIWLFAVKLASTDSQISLVRYGVLPKGTPGTKWLEAVLLQVRQATEIKEPMACIRNSASIKIEGKHPAGCYRFLEVEEVAIFSLTIEAFAALRHFMPGKGLKC